MPSTWMTYEELAVARGIALKSAKTLARRHHWARQIGNDGKVRVSLPEGVTVGPSEVPTEAPSEGLTVGPSVGTSPIHELQARVAVLEVELAGERRRVDTAEADRDAWRDQAKQLAQAQKPKRWALFGTRR